jgi:transposase-like protein
MGAVTVAEVVETGERRNKLGHRILPGAERARLIAAYQASGLTMAAFARRESINYATLAGWMSKVERTPVPARKPIAFAQVQLPGPVATTRNDEMLEVRMPDGTVLRGRRATELAALIRALRA